MRYWHPTLWLGFMLLFCGKVLARETPAEPTAVISGANPLGEPSFGMPAQKLPPEAFKDDEKVVSRVIEPTPSPVTPTPSKEIKLGDTIQQGLIVRFARYIDQLKKSTPPLTLEKELLDMIPANPIFHNGPQDLLDRLRIMSQKVTTKSPRDQLVLAFTFLDAEFKKAPEQMDPLARKIFEKLKDPKAEELPGVVPPLEKKVEVVQTVLPARPPASTTSTPASGAASGAPPKTAEELAQVIGVSLPTAPEPSVTPVSTPLITGVPGVTSGGTPAISKEDVAKLAQDMGISLEPKKEVVSTFGPTTPASAPAAASPTTLPSTSPTDIKPTPGVVAPKTPPAGAAELSSSTSPPIALTTGGPSTPSGIPEELPTPSTPSAAPVTKAEVVTTQASERKKEEAAKLVDDAAKKSAEVSTVTPVETGVAKEDVAKKTAEALVPTTPAAAPVPTTPAAVGTKPEETKGEEGAKTEAEAAKTKADKDPARLKVQKQALEKIAANKDMAIFDAKLKWALEEALRLMADLKFTKDEVEKVSKVAATLDLQAGSVSGSLLQAGQMPGAGGAAATPLLFASSSTSGAVPPYSGTSLTGLGQMPLGGTSLVPSVGAPGLVSSLGGGLTSYPTPGLGGAPYGSTPSPYGGALPYSPPGGVTPMSPLTSSSGAMPVSPLTSSSTTTAGSPFAPLPGAINTAALESLAQSSWNGVDMLKLYATIQQLRTTNQAGTVADLKRFAPSLGTVLTHPTNPMSLVRLETILQTIVTPPSAVGLYKAPRDLMAVAESDQQGVFLPISAPMPPPPTPPVEAVPTPTASTSTSTPAPESGAVVPAEMPMLSAPIPTTATPMLSAPNLPSAPVDTGIPTTDYSALAQARTAEDLRRAAEAKESRDKAIQAGIGLFSTLGTLAQSFQETPEQEKAREEAERKAAAAEAAAEKEE